jgi:predicted phosphoribosyltransferase
MIKITTTITTIVALAAILLLLPIATTAFAADISQKTIWKKKENYRYKKLSIDLPLYRKKELQPLENKINDKTIAILVDDGAASGATVIAAARSIRKTFSPNNKLIIALPVAPKETVELLRREADHVEVVTTPSSYFNSVGQYYQSFESVSDEKVIEIMRHRNLL